MQKTIAVGCQKETASKIIKKEADYILALKGNRGHLLEQAEDSFRFLPPVSSDEQTDAEVMAGWRRAVARS